MPELATAAPEAFKETKIDAIPGGWKVARVGKLCQLRREKVDPTRSPEMPYVGLEHIDSGDSRLQRWGSSSDVKSSKARFLRGDVLYGKLRPYLDKAVLAEFEGICSTDILVLRPDLDLTTPEFLVYTLHTQRLLLHAMSTSSGTNLPRTRWTSLRTFNVALPALAEQRRIAHVLSTIQRAIKAQDKVIAAAKELKRSLMQRLFTYGPGAEPAPTKETEIGRIPAHWSVVPLKLVAEVKTSTSSLSSARQRQMDTVDNATKVLYLKVSDFNAPMNWKLVTQSKESLLISRTDLREMNTVPPNSVIFPKRGAAIRTNKKRITAYHSLLDPNLIAVVPRAEVDYRYLFNWFETLDLASILEETPIPQLNKKDIEPLACPLPPTPEQRQIADSLLVSDSKIETECRRKVSLLELFKSMLHQLMTGQLRVKDLEV